MQSAGVDVSQAFLGDFCVIESLKVISRLLNSCTRLFTIIDYVNWCS